MKKKFVYRVESRRLPNGMVTRFQLIEHPGAVLIVPRLKKDQVIVLRQYRVVLKKYLYELPAGNINRGETPFACARRELIEETGYRGKRWQRLGLIYPVPGYSTEKIFIYEASDLVPASAEKDADEIIHTKVMSRSQIKQLFRKGLIQDAKTICALAFKGWI
ncbi:MAG: NUDIX hydrolase [Candidatus Omnitrophica bacterium]|nr:NUDIX hydrolase [Candidatus Omnitrophota bacterium]